MHCHDMRPLKFMKVMVSGQTAWLLNSFQKDDFFPSPWSFKLLMLEHRIYIYIFKLFRLFHSDEFKDWFDSEWFCSELKECSIFNKWKDDVGLDWSTQKEKRGNSFSKEKLRISRWYPPLFIFFASKHKLLHLDPPHQSRCNFHIWSV